MDTELRERIVMRMVSLYSMDEAFFCAAHEVLKRQGFTQDLAYLIGIAGMGNEATMCAHDCLCREYRNIEWRLRQLAERLGTEVIQIEAGRHKFDEAWQLIADELRAGRPAIGYNLHGRWDYDLIIGFDNEERKLFYQNWKSGYVKLAYEWGRRKHWRVIALRGHKPHWGQRTLELDGIANMVVRARHPMIDGGCGALDGRAENAIGLAAYRLWAERVASPEHSGDLAKGMRLTWWIDHRKLGIKFLRDIAPHHDPVTGKQLQLAADILQRELEDALLPLQELCPPSNTDENKRRQRDSEVKKKQSLLMNRAELIQRELVKALEPVAFRHFGLVGESAQIIALDFDGVFNPQRVALLNKMLLSTDPRVRSLAASTAARSRSERLAPELRRALLDRDEQLAHNALAALKAIKPKGLAGMLSEAYERSPLTKENGGPPDSLKRQIVFVAADVADPRAMEVLRSAYLGKGHDDPATARWAAQAIAKIEGTKAVPTFIANLDTKSRIVVLASIAALRFLHSTRARPQLEDLAGSLDRDIREEAVAALAAME